MSFAPQNRALADELLDALDRKVTLEPITRRIDGFDLENAYQVLEAVAEARSTSGWHPVGRKIGFTNRTLWELFDVDAPIWATVWDRTLTWAPTGEANIPLDHLVQPRIEPEVAFGLSAPVPLSDDPEEVLTAVDWCAPAFELVQCVFPEWAFTLPDATAAFGLHGHLVVGPPVPVTDQNRPQLAVDLATFEATLSRGEEVIDRGSGSNVLDSPALALAHLARVVHAHPDQPQLTAGEVITTGTVTNVWPVAPGQSWTAEFGSLGLSDIRVTFD